MKADQLFKTENRAIEKAVGEYTPLLYTVDCPLESIAIKGRCRVYNSGDEHFGSGESFLSDALKDPTWLDLCKVAHQMIKETGDSHHVFLEDVRVFDVEDNTSYLKLIMGS